MKAILATRIGLVALGEWSEKCTKAPVDRDNTKRQGRHEKLFMGATEWEQATGEKFLICDLCKEPFYVSSGTTHYDTPSGDLEPGCLYWDHSLPDDYYWDNQNGPSLCAVLPEGSYWNIDSRASNCTMKDDRTHRCWVRTGEPPNIHVGKDGHTCQAGAGSILVNQGTPSEWHGFLHHGEFHQ